MLKTEGATAFLPVEAEPEAMDEREAAERKLIARLAAGADPLARTLARKAQARAARDGIEARERK